MAKTLKDLLLALLNATLILVALCLFLGWKLASTVDGVTTNLSEKLQVVAPLREEAQGIRGELAALRDELALLQTDGDLIDGINEQRVTTVLDKLDALETKLQTVQTRFADLADSPDMLVDQAVESAADAVADRFVTIRGCGPES